MHPVELKELRKSKGFESQESLARAAGVSLQTINRWERGVYEPNMDTARKVSKALRMSVGAFFTAIDSAEVS